jgi:gamma-glutamyltranspeptidase/glutathione hydrolase
MMRQTFCLLLGFICATGRTPAAEHGYAATVHPLATAAALEAMKSGGNAVDGAIAAAAMLGVVDGHNSGLGGGCFFLVRKPDGSFLCLDGREKAPAAASREMFVRDGKAVPALSQEGPLAVAVPGWLAALSEAARRCGCKAFDRTSTSSCGL